VTQALTPSVLDEGHLGAEGTRCLAPTKPRSRPLLVYLASQIFPRRPSRRGTVDPPVPGDGVAGPLAAAPSLLFGIPPGGVLRPFFDFELMHPDSPIADSSFCQTPSGRVAAEVYDPKPSIAFFREAWMLIPR